MGTMKKTVRSASGLAALFLGSSLSFPAAAQHAADSKPPLSELLRDSLFAEEADRDLAKAEAGYREVLRRFDAERAHAATALLRLAEIRRGRGEIEEAEQLFARVLREFGDIDAAAEVAAVRLGDKAERLVGGEPGGAAVDRVRKMLRESPDLLETEIDGATPLQRAAAAGELEVVRYLLEQGAAVDGEKGAYLNYRTGSLLVTPLGRAVGGGHLEVVEALLDAGAALDPGVLHTAAEAGYLAIVELLVDRGVPLDRRFPSWVLLQGAGEDLAEVVAEKRAPEPTPSPASPQQGWDLTALEIACRRDFGKVARFLIERGADIGGREGAPALAITDAIDHGDAELVRLMLEKGADPDATAAGGRWETALLWRAAERGDGAVVNVLLGAGASIDVPKPEGWGILHGASGDAVPILIEAGADVNSISPQGNSPLTYLGDPPGSVAKARALLAAGADPNRFGKGGVTPLGRAIGAGDEELVDLLLEAGAAVGTESPNYGLPLSIAILHPALVDRLLAAGAEVDAVDSRGWTALRWAAGANQPKSVAKLLAAGANPNGGGDGSPAPITALPDGFKVRSADRESEAEAFEQTVRLLVEFGADVNAMAPVDDDPNVHRSSTVSGPNVIDGKGEPVLFKAARRGLGELVRYLIAKGAKRQVGDQHVYEVAREHPELRAELFRPIYLDEEKRAGVLRVALSDHAMVISEVLPLPGEDEACPYSLFEAFGFCSRERQLASVEARIWRSGRGEPLIANLRELADKADPEADIPLRWGDFVEFRMTTDEREAAFTAKGFDFLYEYLHRTVAIRIEDGPLGDAELELEMSLNSHRKLDGGSQKVPGSLPGTYYIRPSTLSIGYLVSLRDIGVKDKRGDRQYYPANRSIERAGDGGAERSADGGAGRLSLWLKDGDRVVLRGGQPLRTPRPSPVFPPTPRDAQRALP